MRARKRQGCPARGRQARQGSASVGEGHWLPRLRSYVFRLRPDYAVVGRLLEHVSAPARHPRDGEGGGEELLGQADGLQHAGRVELDVGRLWALGMLLVQDLKRDLLDLRCQLEEL